MNIQELERINEAVYAAQGYEHMLPPFIPAWQKPGPNGVECLYIQPRYSSDLNAAFRLVEEMGEKYDCIAGVQRLSDVTRFGRFPRYRAEVVGGKLAYEHMDLTKSFYADTPTIAICEAYIWAVEAHKDWQDCQKETQ
jgi:hypothetical protein